MDLRLLPLDDNDVVRAGLRSLIAEKQGWHVCGEAADGASAVSKVLELAPDVVILDLSMPVMNGADAAREIHRLAPPTKIILFSVHRLPLTASGIVIDAFVSKASGRKDLIPTIECVTERLVSKPFPYFLSSIS
jgi:DNA-binding NarL/FixJ family response regulator